VIADTLDLAAASQEMWDAVVLGAGPAGAVAAHGLAAQGVRVLLVDARSFPRSKVCGGCLNRRSLAVLDQAGLRDRIDALAPVPLNEFRLGSRGRTLSLELPGGLAVSRYAMDAALVAAAIEAGSQFLSETRGEVGAVHDDHRDVELIRHGEPASVRTRIVVVATGLATRSLPGIEGFVSREARGSRIGVEATLPDFPAEYGPGIIFMAVGRSGYVGLTRVEDGRLNVAAAVDKSALREHKQPSAACTAILKQAGFPVSAGMRDVEWHGTIGLTRRPTRRADERLFLVGDAAGYIEPFTGEGMAWALSSGQEVVSFVCEGLRGWRGAIAQSWEERYRRLIESRQWLCRTLAAGLRHPSFIRSMFPLVSRFPSLANPVIRRLNQEL